MKIRKTILASVGAISLVAPAMSSVVSCAQYKPDYQKLTADIKLTALEEFIDICKIPRPSLECGKIYQYLKNRITQIGYTPIDLGVGRTGKVLGVYKNIYFDIPATKGCNNYKPIILQGHMDMVRTGEGVDTGEHLKKGIEPVFDSKDGQMVIHSKEYKTSLGADDGIGLGAMLSIARHQSEFRHGLIRCIITYDEEEGLYGAEDIKANAPQIFDGFNQLLNIDAEVDCGIVHQSYGICKLNFNVSSTAETLDSSNIVQVKLHGLHGGHSGEDIGYKYANAERLVYETLNKVLTDNAGSYIKLIKCNHLKKDPEKGWIESSPKHNSIISDFELWIETDLSHDVFEPAYNSLLDGWKQKYTGEKWDSSIEFDAEKTEEIQPEDRALSADVSKKYIKLFGEKVLCGIYDMRDEEKHIPGSSGNVGPTAFKLDNNIMNIISVCNVRSDVDSVVQDVGSENPESVTSEFKKYNYTKCFSEVFEQSEYKFDAKQVAVGWHAKTIDQGNKLWNLLDKGFNDIAGHKPELASAYGSLECTSFHETKQDVDIISTGAKILNCHSNNETLYINSLDNEYKALLYVLINAQNLK